MCVVWRAIMLVKMRSKSHFLGGELAVFVLVYSVTSCMKALTFVGYTYSGMSAPGT